ncbi:MAG: TlpA family protein disulfide reductase [Bdellovibrionia bacterium]
MKKLNVNRIINILLIVLVVYTFGQRIPQWWELWQEEGKSTQAIELTKTDDKTVSLPILGEKNIFIFWATWCGPCTVELNRINEAIKNSEIDARFVHAISLQEEFSLVKQTALDRGYLFNVYADSTGKSLQQYKVNGTPTIYLIDEKGVVSFSSMGLSPLLIKRAKDFISSTP